MAHSAAFGVTGYYNAVDGLPPLAPGQLKSFPTEQSMLDEWNLGHLTAVISSNKPPDAVAVQTIDDRFVVVIDKSISDESFQNRICAASPEQRDYLAALLQRTKQTPSDLKLLTQEQYLDDSTCVDIFVTSVASPSKFLQSLPFEFYIKQMHTDDQTEDFPAHTYNRSYNVKQITTQKLILKLFR